MVDGAERRSNQSAYVGLIGTQATHRSSCVGVGDFIASLFLPDQTANILIAKYVACCPRSRNDRSNRTLVAFESDESAGVRAGARTGGARCEIRSHRAARERIVDLPTVQVAEQSTDDRVAGHV